MLPPVNAEQYARLVEFAAALESGQLKVKDLEAVLPNQDPVVKTHIAAAFAAYDMARNGGGRSLPFQERITTREVTDTFNLDDKVAERVYQEAYDNSLAVGLIDRMGSDADLPIDGEPTLREQVAAAFDANTQE